MKMRAFVRAAPLAALAWVAVTGTVRAADPVFVQVSPSDGEALRHQPLVFRVADADEDLRGLALDVRAPGGAAWFALDLTNGTVALPPVPQGQTAQAQYGVSAVTCHGEGTTGTWTVVLNTAHPAWQRKLAGALLADFGFTARAYDAAGGSATQSFTLGVQRMAEADFNGDGKADPAILVQAGGYIRYIASDAATADPSAWPVQPPSSMGQPGWVPAVGDYDGDGVADLAWYIRPYGEWRLHLSSLGYNEIWPRPFLGSGQDEPAPADYDGDGKTDLAVVQATDGKLRISTGNNWGTAKVAAGGVPVAADYDGDGKTDPAWYMPATGRWRILETSTGHGERMPRPVCGGPLDLPVPADYDGDGKADVAVVLAATGQLKYLRSSDGGEVVTAVGRPSWLAAPADFDGDGKADYAWYIPAKGQWIVCGSLAGYAKQRIAFGGPLDRPLVADFDGDGKADLVLRQADGRIRWRGSAAGVEAVSAAGQPDWQPALGDYDGDGKADYAWFVPSSQRWRVYPSSRGYAEIRPRSQFGFDPGDRVAPGDYDGDGKADLALCRAGTGQYRVCTGRTWVTAPGAPGWLAAPADYDGDGKADYAWYIPRIQTWRVFESANGYAQRPDVVFGSASGWPHRGDFDGDGKTDFVVVQTNGALAVRESASGLTWTTDLPPSAAAGSARWWPAVSDYNGDGRDDAAWYRSGAGDFRIVFSDGDNTDGNGAAGQRALSRTLGGETDFPVIRPLPRSLSRPGGSTVDQIGNAEYLGAGGFRPHVATDADDQPHAVFQENVGELLLYDRIGGAWRETRFVNPIGSEVNFPHIEIDQHNNRQWISAVMIQVGDVNRCGMAMLSRTHVNTAPSAVAFQRYVFPFGDLAANIPLGNIAVDPQQPNKAYLYCNVGYWQEFAGSGNDAASFAATANYGQRLLNFQAGERNLYGFQLSKAPVASGPSVWHASFVGAPWWTPSGYLNTVRETLGQGIVTWSNPSLYDSNEENYGALGADRVNSLAAYMAIYGQNGLIYAQAYDGQRMVHPVDSPLTMSARSGVFRYPPQWASAAGGGCWLCWDGDDGRVKLRWIRGDGSQDHGPVVDVCNGNTASIATDSQGHIHLVYYDGGLRYRMITTR